jgi:hypothetical protein
MMWMPGSLPRSTATHSVPRSARSISHTSPCSVILIRDRQDPGEPVAAPTEEASDIRWVQPDQIGSHDIHPAILRRIRHRMESAGPHVD